LLYVDLQLQQLKDAAMLEQPSDSMQAGVTL